MCPQDKSSLTHSNNNPFTLTLETLFKIWIFKYHDPMKECVEALLGEGTRKNRSTQNKCCLFEPQIKHCFVPSLSVVCLEIGVCPQDKSSVTHNSNTPFALTLETLFKIWIFRYHDPMKECVKALLGEGARKNRSTQNKCCLFEP